MRKRRTKEQPEYTLINILDFKLQGLSNRRIGKIFGKSESSVRYQLKKICKSLHITSFKTLLR